MTKLTHTQEELQGVAITFVSQPAPYQSTSDFASINVKLNRDFKAFPYWLKEERSPAMLSTMRRK